MVPPGEAGAHNRLATGKGDRIGPSLVDGQAGRQGGAGDRHRELPGTVAGDHHVVPLDSDDTREASEGSDVGGRDARASLLKPVLPANVETLTPWPGTELSNCSVMSWTTDWLKLAVITATPTAAPMATAITPVRL